LLRVGINEISQPSSYDRSKGQNSRASSSGGVDGGQEVRKSRSKSEDQAKVTEKGLAGYKI